MNQERLKQWSIGWRDPLYTLALALGCVCLLAITVVVIVGAFYAIPAIKDWRHASAATTKVYEEGLGSVTDAAQNVKAATAEVAPTLKGLQADEAEVKEYVVALRGQTQTLTAGLNGVLSSVRTVSDEARAQLKQNGDEAARTLASARTAIDDTDVLIKNTDREATRLLSASALIIETANPKLQALLAHADTVIVDADGTIKAYQPAGDKLTSVLGHFEGVSAHLENMSADSDKKWHSILFPAPVKGFWPNVGRVLQFVYKPVFDGVNLYFRLSALPVRVTQPIPILK
jgi:hypothetical protein